MLFRTHPRRDEQAALAFADLASALDAGLPLANLGGDAADGERVLTALLRRRQIELSAADASALEAAWVAGRGPAALRRLADQRQRRAAFVRSVRQSLRYPLALIAMSLLVATTAGSVFGGRWLPITAVLIAAGLATLIVCAVRGLRRGSERWRAMPLLGPLAQDLAEVPYLEILHSLYASGVPLLQAHARAVAGCPVASVQARLLAADHLLQQGRPLAEALATFSPVDSETQTLLQNGEHAGDLEGALQRALQRRRDVAERRTGQLARILGTAAYVVGASIAFATIWSFYSGYFAALRGLRH